MEQGLDLLKVWTVLCIILHRQRLWSLQQVWVGCEREAFAQQGPLYLEKEKLLHAVGDGLLIRVSGVSDGY